MCFLFVSVLLFKMSELISCVCADEDDFLKRKNLLM